MPSSAVITVPFDNSYAQLGTTFSTRQTPDPVSSPAVLAINETLARSLGLDPDELRSPAGLAMLAGNTLPADADPIAMVYAGHQFGHWNPQLGDGRAILLGELIDTRGVRQDIQLKGAGRTPYSRGGDGRNWIGPVLREYVISEAMSVLGVPTTRALAAVTTGEAVRREQPMPGAVLTRVARSHIRVGTFQYFAARQQTDAIRELAEYVMQRHFPQTLDADRPALALLTCVVQAQARLIAHWQALGFIHGVMNTDNASVTGDTIDYGPCAFMDGYQADKVFSSIDHGARYAYRNQPRIAQWNMANFAQCLLPLIDDDEAESLAQAQAAVTAFDERFIEAYAWRMQAKLGLTTRASAGDQALTETDREHLVLITDLLVLMETGQTDFTLFFRTLSQDIDAARTMIDEVATFDAWLDRWQACLDAMSRSMTDAQVAMLQVNPAVIPRNHRIEAMIQSAVTAGDLAPLEQLMKTLASPFSLAADASPLAQPPQPSEVVTQTFCGT